jgi:GT2 family glycosyltransferase
VRVSVIVATKGRPDELVVLLELLAGQTRAADDVIMVGTSPEDFPGGAPSRTPGVDWLVSDVAGSSRQRNVGVAHVQHSASDPAVHVMVFFDDDFRPHREWLEHCERTFGSDATIGAMVGTLLADGAVQPAVDEQVARALIDADCVPTEALVAASDRMYGCNMAIRGTILQRASFCEDLPLFGWLEDLDMYGQIRRRPDTQVVWANQAVGVHLGSRRAKGSGRRFGYSQVANPIHIRRRGNISMRECWAFVGRAVVGNAVRRFRRSGDIDYAGRLAGSTIALADWVRRRSHPTRMLDL